MKHKNLMYFLLICLFFSCEKKFKEINDIIPEKMLHQIKEHMPVYEGNNPPELNKSYVISPCILHYSSLGLDTGASFKDYPITFSEQNKDKQLITFSGNKEFLRIDTCHNASIVGNGNNFTLYYKSKGEYYTGTKYETAVVFSATKTSSGLKDPYLGVVVLKRNNASDTLMLPTGTIRIICDGDNFADTLK